MGIRFYNSLSSYGNYTYNKPVAISEAAPQEVETKEAQLNTQPEEKAETLSDAQLERIDSRSKTADPESVSLTFNKESSFDYIGQDAPLRSLDMDKAISDMKKDSILQEYSYFVGNSSSLFGSEDGVVIAK